VKQGDLSDAVVEVFKYSTDPIFKESAKAQYAAKDPVWQFQVHPHMNSSFGWVLNRYIQRGWLEQFAMNSKGKMTVWNLPTQQGNYFSNVGALSLYFGNTPLDALAQTIVGAIKLAKFKKLKSEMSPSRKYKEGAVKIDDTTKRAYEQLDNISLEGSDLAQAELLRLKELDNLGEIFSDVGDPKIAAIGSYIKDYLAGDYWLKPSKKAVDVIERGARAAYNFGDAGGKVALYTYHFKVIDQRMKDPATTSIILEQSANSSIVLHKKKGRWYFKEGQSLSQKQIDRYIAIAAERNAYRMIPNYMADVGALIPILRNNIMTGPFSWFPTWSYKMAPLPGKRGIIDAIFFDDNTYTPVTGNTVSMAHIGTQSARTLRTIAYMNSLKGIANDVDVFNGQVTEGGPGTFTLGNSIYYDGDEAGYGWVSSTRNMNSIAPNLIAYLLALKTAGSVSELLYGTFGMEAPKETKKLNDAFEKGFLSASPKDALDIALLTGNVVSEILMTEQGAKQFGFRKAGKVDYLNKAGAALIGGTPAQIVDGLLASGGPESEMFNWSRYQFASPYYDGDTAAAVPISKMIIQRVFGGFKKINMRKKDLRFVDRFTDRLNSQLTALKNQVKMVYRSGDSTRAEALKLQITEIEHEIQRQVEILRFRRIKPGKYVNVGSYAD
jgi:hypothetical protein